MTNNILQLIPRYESYVEYEIEMYIKMPKIAKFNVGNEMLKSVFFCLENIYLIQKIKSEKRIEILNKIDASFSYQRSCLRVMYKQRYIDEKKFNVSMKYLKELGQILGAYIKSNNIRLS